MSLKQKEGGSCSKMLTLPEDGQQQIECIDSWGLSSFQSDHMEGTCRQTLSRFPLPREQSDKLSPQEASSAANCTKFDRRWMDQYINGPELP